MEYPLEIQSIGEDTYILISRGHHDIHIFMRKVREEYEWLLGMPVHIWMKTVPARKDSGYNEWYYPAHKETRGAWPCTYVTESYGKDSYESQLLTKNE